MGKQTNSHVQLMIDNTTVVAYSKNIGGCHSLACNRIVQEILEWALDCNTQLSASYLPGALNMAADRENRTFHFDQKWMIHKDVLLVACSM